MCIVRKKDGAFLQQETSFSATKTTAARLTHWKLPFRVNIYTVIEAFFFTPPILLLAAYHS